MYFLMQQCSVYSVSRRCAVRLTERCTIDKKQFLIGIEDDISLEKKCIYTIQNRTKMQQIQSFTICYSVIQISEKVFRISDEAFVFGFALTQKWFAIRLRLPNCNYFCGIAPKENLHTKTLLRRVDRYGRTFWFRPHRYPHILTLIHPITVTHTHVVRSHIQANRS